MLPLILYLLFFSRFTSCGCDSELFQFPMFHGVVLTYTLNMLCVWGILCTNEYMYSTHIYIKIERKASYSHRLFHWISEPLNPKKIKVDSAIICERAIYVNFSLTVFLSLTFGIDNKGPYENPWFCVTMNALFMLCRWWLLFSKHDYIWTHHIYT